MNCKQRLETYLRENDIIYHIQHDTSAYTAQEVAWRDHVPGKLLAKVVIVIADDKPVMLVLPALERVYLPEVARVLGAEVVRLANEEELAREFPDCELGAMPPFGNLYNIPVYVDKALSGNYFIFFQPGTHIDTMSLAYDDFARLVHPVVAEFSLDEALDFAW
ncbi:MAG: aminoacyl-tRNA deacylase [Chloroflexia bacterium]